jgi:lysophospholipase L1-like esterase
MKRSLVVHLMLLPLLLFGIANTEVRSSEPPGAQTARPWYASELDGFAASDLANFPPSCAILFTGSSSIRLWESLARDMAPAPVINRGFGGSTIADVADSFYQVVAPYNPKAIFFYAGENDVNAGRSSANVFSDFRRFMALKSEALGDVPVYFISLKPSKLRFNQRGEQSKVNAMVKRLARRHRDLHFIDVVPAMLEKGKPRHIYREDGLHMTEKGYRLWTGIIRPAVLSEAARRTKRCPKG